MFVLKPEARRASCVRSMLSVLLAVKTMGTTPCSWLSHQGGRGDDNGHRQIKHITFYCSWQKVGW